MQSMIDVPGVQDELAIQYRVLVEADINGRSASFRTVIVKICSDEIWLGMSSPDRRLEGMHEDQTIRLTVARSNAALLGRSGFLRPIGGSKSRVFAVVRPGVLERVQRRSHVRYQIDLPLYFRHLDPVSLEPRGKAAGAVTVNAGPGGLLFASGQQLSLGDELDLTLPLSGGDRISMIGAVMRVREAVDGAASPTGQTGQTEAAVKLTRITAVDQDRIVRFILMTEHRRRAAQPIGSSRRL
jgi:c-di-GMP-binding flagellar brake protein YcgR